MATASKAFYWSGIDSSGTRVKNLKLMAVSQDAALAQLAREGCTPTKVSSSGGGVNVNMELGSGEVKFKWAQKADFARRLYQLQRAGVSTPKALMSIGEDAPANVAQMCATMADQLSAGVSLSEAMRAYPKAFDDVFVSYVSAGEESGTMLASLESLTVLLAKRAAMQSKIKGVMAYPKMVGGTILILTVGIILFLVPRFVDIYTSFGAELPAPTLVMMAISKNFLPITGADTVEAWMRIPIPFTSFAINPLAILMLVLYAFLAWKLFRKYTADNADVNIFLDKVKFKIPLMGKLNHKSALYRWASTLGGSLNAGVNPTRALDLAARSSGSLWIQSLTPNFIEAVQSGRSISTEMSKYPELFPTNMRTMAATGEDTGELDVMLQSIALTLDEEIDSLVAGLSAKIEVALLLVLGVVVGGLLLILYLPILNLAGAASKGLSEGNT